MLNKTLTNTVVISFYTLLSIFFTWPLLVHLHEGFISPDTMGDSSSYIWDVYIFKNNIANNNPLFHTEKVLSPIGGNLWMHGYMPGMCSFSLLFKNNFLGMNLYIMLHFILSAFGAYLLSMYLNKNKLISFIIGAAFSFSAYKMLRLTEHYTLVLTATIPFYILCFLKAFDFSTKSFLPVIISKKHFYLCILLGFLTILNDYYATFYLLYFSFAWFAFYKFYPYWINLSRIKKTGMLLILFIGMHLIIEPLVIHGFDDKGGIWWGGNMLAFFIPNDNSWLYNNASLEPLTSIAYRGMHNLENQLFLGYSIIFVGIILLYNFFKNNLPKETAPWIFITAIFFLLATPIIYFGSHKIIYSPTAIIHFIPFFNNIRCNTRTVMMIELTLPIIAGYFWAQTIARKPNILYSYALPVLLLFYMIVEFKPKPYNLLVNADAPAIYDAVAKSPNNKVLIMPTGVNDGLHHIGNFNNLEHFYQTIHKKSITGGYLSRVSDKVFESYQNDSIMNTLILLSENANYPFSIPSQSQITTFNNTFNVDMYLIKPDYINTNAEKYIIVLLKGKSFVITEKDGFKLYELK
ncbi:hypothetical protein [Cytophaga hutchinsonii]|uniref:Glycosyltransferase RgtA/B/C/D-like domain-containing protein n=1 Tax=Cytophaga hutchinsonii (strain ATCC 33406 / DSM 1761 / CIP 103989 / NBRC 15051 / NCIMB 9469 / D465) TaxID=269798 RepID=A0A6N4SV84_CYTH3|nr:hypothetical protein [Cytophaga hutchinsonii]ABG60242.1 conserved hypothetical protein [Cytophaga hutchinsonii ATCC 33406]SFX20991.1 hypothetical protein SAMN04487930_10256 [Cytophaga hutchinsonii ATCC 33406]